ncbi:beta-alanine transporter-like [Tachypleus tridentatus]|uniref:beta-alanine transporter-like n=1 Tax=Tachypleus tridentatus TaxID=6853 RepID=UPI003FD50A65
MDWDGIAQMVGEYDKYQMLMVWLVFVPAHLSFGPHYYEQLFMSITPYYWCDPSVSNLSSKPKYRTTVTTEQTPVSPGSRGQCWVTYSNISNSAEINSFDPNRSRMRTSDHVTLACTNGYIYDRSWLHSDESIVTAWDLVCDRSWLVPLTMTLFLMGCLFGQCLCLFVAHRYGRRKPFFVFLGAQCVVGMVTAFVSDLSSFTILRFFMGTTVPGVLSSPSALAREIVGSPYRVKIWFVSTAAQSLGVLLLAPIAVLIRDWTLLSLTTSLPFVAFFFYWWVLPESPPWLITRGRFQETGRLLCNISQTNGKSISPDFIVSLKRRFRIETALQDGNTKKAEPTLLNLFYTPNLCRKTLLIMSIWLLSSSSFVGLTYYAFEIDEHVNLNYFLACCAEF